MIPASSNIGKLGVQPKLIGPKAMITKITQNIEDRKVDGVKRPSSVLQKENKNQDSDDDYNNDFEADAGGAGEDEKLEKLRKAIDRENQKAVKHASEK